MELRNVEHDAIDVALARRVGIDANRSPGCIFDKRNEIAKRGAIATADVEGAENCSAAYQAYDGIGEIVDIEVVSHLHTVAGASERSVVDCTLQQMSYDPKTWTFRLSWSIDIRRPHHDWPRHIERCQCTEKQFGGGFACAMAGKRAKGGVLRGWYPFGIAVHRSSRRQEDQPHRRKSAKCLKESKPWRQTRGHLSFRLTGT